MRKLLICFLLISTLSVAQTTATEVTAATQDAITKASEAIAAIMTVQTKINDWQAQEFAAMRQQIADLRGENSTLKEQIDTAQILWNIGVACEATSCTLTWRTSAPTQAHVSYGTTLSPTKALPAWTSDLQTERSVTIANLTPGTKHYFYAKARDASGFEYSYRAMIAGTTTAAQ